jgi:hypothetical protein
MVGYYLEGVFMEDNLFFSELGVLNSPRSQEKTLIALDTPQSLEVCGQLSEGIILNDCVTIPIVGPALEVVALTRWLGEKGFRQLLDDGVFKFCFCPGILTFMSERNIKQLNLKIEPGLYWIVGKDDSSWEDIIEAVKLALVEQLNFSIGKAGRWGRAIEKYTTILPIKEIRPKAEQDCYNLAFSFLKGDSIKEIDDLRKLDHERDKELVQQFLNISSANFDLNYSARLICSDVYGNNLTWQIAQPSGIEKDKKYNLSKILELEDIPDIAALVRDGWPVNEIIKTRNDKRCIEFRKWLKTIPNETDNELLKAYYNTFKRSKSDSLVTKVIRFGIINLIGIPSPEIAFPVSIIDAFWFDKIRNGWNPRIFIEKHFKYTLEK